MRIGIDYRILTDPFALLGRGIGRFTQQQLAEVLKLDGENEYILLCVPGSDDSGVLPEIRGAPNVSRGDVDIPGFARMSEHDPAALSMLSREVGRWLRQHRIDLYHATSPFVLDQPDLPQLDACPMVATVYDLIPYVFPESYLPGKVQREAYLRAANFVTEATRVIAISESTARDVSSRWGYPSDRIDVCSPFAASGFAPLPADVRDAALRDLRKRTLLPHRYIVTVSALHPVKNLPLLLDAYALLPASLRVQLPLVVCCHLEPTQADEVRGLCQDLGIAGDVVLTGFVTDEELVAVYNGAELLVHPSSYEGFGLPVLEAMQCGTPVVTTATSSLAEVAGGAAVLVDPGDAAALAAAITALSLDERRRGALRQAGLDRAKVFTASQLGRSTLASYTAAASGAPPPPLRVLAPPAGSVTIGSARRATVAATDDGAGAQDEIGLRAQIDRLERALANARARHDRAVAELTDAACRSRQLETDLARAREHEVSARILSELGPATVAVAQRWRALSRRHPTVASAVRAMARRLARLAGRQ